MSWWNRHSKPEDDIQDPVSEPLKFGDTVRSMVVEAVPGQIIPCDDPKEVVVVPKDPEPDLSTKPKDVVGYCFGFVCPKKHVHSPFESITTDGYKELRACQTCGGVSKPAVVKRTAEAMWGNTARIDIWDRNPKPKWRWYNAHWDHLGLCYQSFTSKETIWTKFEFVHYLESPKRRKK